MQCVIFPKLNTHVWYLNATMKNYGNFWLKQDTWDILTCVIFHWLIFTGVTLYQLKTVRCDISTKINDKCVSGTNFSNNCETMASSEHGCVQDGKDLHRQVWYFTCSISMWYLWRNTPIDTYILCFSQEGGVYKRYFWASASLETCAPGRLYFVYSVFLSVTLACSMHSPESLFPDLQQLY